MALRCTKTNLKLRYSVYLALIIGIGMTQLTAKMCKSLVFLYLVPASVDYLGAGILNKYETCLFFEK